MNFNKTFLTLGLAATLLQMPTSSFAQNAGGKRQNPLLVKSSLPFGAHAEVAELCKRFPLYQD